MLINSIQSKQSHVGESGRRRNVGRSAVDGVADLSWAILPESPVGPLRLIGTRTCLHRLEFSSRNGVAAFPALPIDCIHCESDFDEPLRQLGEFFSGQLRHFTVSLAPLGTVFQQKVWQQLQQVPWGTTASYGEIAAAIGQPTASRAVGLANSRNPLPILIPCHRIIGRQRSLTGYNGGLERKRILLQLEGFGSG